MGKLLALVLVLVSLAAIAGLLLRPGTVIGVSDDALAESIARSTDSGETGVCDGSDEEKTCSVGMGGGYAVTIGDYGCWDAEPAARGGMVEDLSGCVTVLDYAGIGS